MSYWLDVLRVLKSRKVKVQQFTARKQFFVSSKINLYLSVED